MKLYFIEIFLLGITAFLLGAVISGKAVESTFNLKFARCIRGN